jgi:hypothetical protein
MIPRLQFAQGILLESSPYNVSKPTLVFNLRKGHSQKAHLTSTILMIPHIDLNSICKKGLAGEQTFHPMKNPTRNQTAQSR